jgi:hypothetical protein
MSLTLIRCCSEYGGAGWRPLKIGSGRNEVLDTAPRRGRIRCWRQLSQKSLYPRAQCVFLKDLDAREPTAAYIKRVGVHDMRQQVLNHCLVALPPCVIRTVAIDLVQSGPRVLNQLAEETLRISVEVALEDELRSGDAIGEDYPTGEVQQGQLGKRNQRLMLNVIAGRTQ